MFKAAYRRLSASLAIKEDKKVMKGGMPAVCRQYSNRGGKTDDERRYAGVAPGYHSG